MLSIVTYLSYIQYAHQDQKLIANYICRVCVAWKTCIFMYFSSDGLFFWIWI